MSIEVRNISKKFGSFVALDNVSLNMPKPASWSRCWAVGSGKTTLLRIIAGLEMPDTGEVHFDRRRGHRIAACASARSASSFSITHCSGT